MSAPDQGATTPMPRLSQEMLAPPVTIPPPAEVVPGQSTTLGGAASQPMLAEPVESSRRWIPITVAATVVAIVGVIVLVASGGSDSERVAAATPDAAEVDSAAVVAANGAQGEGGEPGDMEVGADTAGVGTAPEPGLEAGADLGADGEVKAGGSGEDGAGLIEIVPEPEMVKLTIESTPPGAAVRLSGSKEVLGTTPYTHEVQRGSKKLTFALALEGHGHERVKLSTDRDASKHVKLAASSGSKKHGKTTGKTPPDTKDPFGRAR
jgi:hypothetical protein